MCETEAGKLKPVKSHKTKPQRLIQPKKEGNSQQADPVQVINY